MQTRKAMKTRVLGTSAMLLLMGASFNAVAFGTQDDQSDVPLQSEFKKLDRDHDGKLTREEAAGDKQVGPTFDQADINADGVLVIEEYSPYKSSVQQKHVKRYLDDSAVTAQVKAELIKDSGLKGLEISVETHKGTVILSGFVENQQQISRAVQIASSVEGVTSVKNSLEIKG